MKKVIWMIGIQALCTFAAMAQTDTLPFSPWREAGGFLYLSGQIALPPEGGTFTVAEETKAIMEKIGAILKEKGYTFDEVVRATVYLRNIDDYAAMNRAYAPFFNAPNFPARVCVGGMDLVRNCRVEISCVAYKEKP